MLSNRNLVLVSRIILGALFIYASYDKVLNPLGFAKIIHNYRIFPPDLINIAAIMLPWIEFIAGLLLIIGYKVRGASLIIGGLLVIYIVMLGVTAARGINISCGCFTTSMAVKSNLYLRIAEDVVMLLLALHVLVFYKTRRRRFA